MERAAADEAATGRARKEALLAGIQALRRPEVQAVLAADDAAALEARILAQKEKRRKRIKEGYDARPDDELDDVFDE